MILFTFENDYNTAIKTEAFTSAREQFTSLAADQR